MNKKLIRLTESDLHRIVRESVNNVITELFDSPKTQDVAGQLAKRASNRAVYYDNEENPDPRWERYNDLSYNIRNRAETSQKKHGMGGEHFTSGWNKESGRNMRRKDNARRKYGM